MQIAIQARLCRQCRIGLVQIFGQRLLQCDEVVDAFCHEAGEFLHAREAIEFQRVEGANFLFGLDAGLDLRFRLNLDFAQLPAQPRHVLHQFGKPLAEGVHFPLDPRAGDTDFTRIVDETIDQISPHAQHGAAFHFFGGQRLQRDGSLCRLGLCVVRFHGLGQLGALLDGLRRDREKRAFT